VSKWPIRQKLLFGFALLLVLAVTLAFSGFQGVYAYRSLVRNLSARSSELPRAGELNAEVSDLRMTLGELRGLRRAAHDTNSSAAAQLHSQFAKNLDEAEATLAKYSEQLTGSDRTEGRISDNRREWETVRKLEATLETLRNHTQAPDWTSQDAAVTQATQDVNQIHELAGELPNFLHEQIHSTYHEVRAQYRTWIILEWATSIFGGVLLLLLVKLSYDWVIKPLRLILRGSRQVASGDFDYRIQLDSHDEMRELAEAMNAMTARFQAIRDDLDRQVAERTKQVIRSEQLASVGFLAAGVAHEINNPLASIAICAESLEGRIVDALAAGHEASDADREVIRNYLQMIQTEAFRCKGITERLLDFSRRGDSQRHATDLRELVSGVIEMVGHLGKYHDLKIDFVAGQTVIAPVNPPELKQVVLNLLTNGLESLSPGGVVKVEIRQHSDHAEIAFTDNGCGMTDEVREHLFEPFFTRRRAGQGIGLGLSITYRIIADHQGQIDVHSDGLGRGSRFIVRLPLNPAIAAPRTTDLKETSHRHQAA
jgi:two-component system NtrC family sensor kinase